LLDDLRDDGVSEAFKTVHPLGYPISHSTHVGFREPPTSAFRGFVFLSIRLGPPLFFASCAVDVGSILTASLKSPRLSFPPDVPSE
jgi:hypothetical protein